MHRELCLAVLIVLILWFINYLYVCNQGSICSGTIYCRCNKCRYSKCRRVWQEGMATKKKRQDANSEKAALGVMNGGSTSPINSLLMSGGLYLSKLRKGSATNKRPCSGRSCKMLKDSFFSEEEHKISPFGFHLNDKDTEVPDWDPKTQQL